MPTVIPEERGVYLDRWGNTWRKHADGVFACGGFPDLNPADYAPFERLHTAAEWAALTAQKETRTMTYAIVNRYNNQDGETVISAVYGGYPTREAAEEDNASSFPWPDLNVIVREQPAPVTSEEN